MDIDIIEQELCDIDPVLLSILLQDKTTKQNIKWATDNYVKYGAEYAATEEIFPELIKKSSQHAAASVYGFVPVQDFTKAWTDDALYKKYGLSDAEISFIENTIKPMESETGEMLKNPTFEPEVE